MSVFPGISTLLIQARTEVDMLQQELDCFLERTRLDRDQIQTRNVITDRLDEESISGSDAVFIGGAGEFSAADEHNWMPGLLTLIQHISRSGIPLFGSCWGHQVIARALGGRVEHDPTKAEMGCLPVELTEEGTTDPLFSGFPRTFLANMGHHDRVTILPPGAVELARSASQPFQAFRISGRPIYGTQFHSELDATRERERLIRYQKFYLDEMPDAGALQGVIDALAETTEVDHLLHDFIRTFVYRPSVPDELPG